MSTSRLDAADKPSEKEACDIARDSARATAWLSQGLESLVLCCPAMAGPAETEASDRPCDFDVVIVGSGYGGAVAAAELAGSVHADGKPITVCVLERGQEYLAGSFPSRLTELAGHTRFATPEARKPRGMRDGLFDLRWSPDACALVASGLGGGSLINAGVMEMPHPAVFQEPRWPQAIRHDADAVIQLGVGLRRRLGARPIDAAREPAKTGVLRTLAGLNVGATTFKTVPVSILPDDGSGTTEANSAGVALDRCLRCADCATGCNHNAKDSLDLNLLRSAQQAGASLYTGASVLWLAKAPGQQPAWDIHLNHTDPHLRDRQAMPFRLRARRVILAAGSFGSTEILMRSRAAGLKVSPLLGKRFSLNGDMIAVAHDLSLAQPVNAVANEAHDPTVDGDAHQGRQVGPSITAMIDLRTGNPATDLVIQDLAVPGPLRRLYEEMVTTADVLRRLVDGDASVHDPAVAPPDDAAIDRAAIQRSLVVAMIGRDTADGELRWGRHAPDARSDGILTVHWPALRDDVRFAAHHDRLAKRLGCSGLGGRLIENPLWRPLSDQLENVFGEQRGPLLTVHPLGGCVMADSARSGVTDDCGRVFDTSVDELSKGMLNNEKPKTQKTHKGLVVLDGSIVPGSLGINPALTIGALALRAITAVKRDWGCSPAAHGMAAPLRLPAALVNHRRPRFRVPKTVEKPNATMIELTEQMRGPAQLRAADRSVATRWIELTLTSQSTDIAALMARDADATTGRCFKLDEGRSRLRILNREPDRVSDISSAAEVDFVAQVSGSLRLFSLEASRPLCRQVHATTAWVFNRGWRDVAQDWLTRRLVGLNRLAPPEHPPQSTYRYVRDILRLTSRAGAVRMLEYDLTIGDAPVASAEQNHLGTLAATHFVGQRIRGVKRLTYSASSSPWTQLTEMTLEVFPRMVASDDLPRLTLNQRYLARKAVPLMRVVSHQDRVSTLTDLASFVLYVARIVLQIHGLSLRKPDAPIARAPRRLPGIVPGLPPPDIQWLAVNSSSKPKPDASLPRIRLARYCALPRPAAPAAPPVLLIHGYSASGTTFAHRAVPHNLARTLCDRGRDVWVLDMRSSAGMPTARGDWTFETMALHDIPIAIEHLLAATGAVKVDVVAHCMGAAMFMMAVLGAKDRFETTNELYKQIGRVVMSQVGPAFVLSPGNVLRAYLMRYVRHFLPIEDYAFSPQGKPSMASQVLDRVLSSMPMPAAEYRRENPLWPPAKFTPWAGTRHRMDALYARTFALCNMGKKVLADIDDFFGPLSVETVSQVIHFAGFKAVTDHAGFNRYVFPANLRERLRFPMLSIHGEENGLADVGTLAHLRDVLQQAGLDNYLNDCDGSSPLAAQSVGAMLALIDKAQPRLFADKASFMTWRIAGQGHQDVLIGSLAAENNKVIAAYLERRPAQEATP